MVAPDKCDRGEPQTERVWREMALLGVCGDEVELLEISAKTGAGVLALLEMVDLFIRNCCIAKFNVSIKRSACKARHVEVEQYVLCGRSWVQEARGPDPSTSTGRCRGDEDRVCPAQKLTESVRKFALLSFSQQGDSDRAGDQVRVTGQDKQQRTAPQSSAAATCHRVAQRRLHAELQ